MYRLYDPRTINDEPKIPYWSIYDVIYKEVPNNQEFEKQMKSLTFLKYDDRIISGGW